MTMKSLMILVALSSVAHAKELTSHKGECAVTVPDNWQGVVSADKRLSAVVTVWWGVDDFAGAKAEAKKRHPKGTVTKESDTELEIEGPPEMGGGLSVHRSIVVGKKMCGVDVIYGAGGGLEDARKIARTLVAK
jgi:hypothetical protein